MSKGAFSYTAGVLHDGITLYDPQKYRPLQGWIVRAPDGSFDEALVARRLARCSAIAELAPTKNCPDEMPGREPRSIQIVAGATAPDERSIRHAEPNIYP